MKKPTLDEREFEMLEELFMTREVFDEAYSIRVNGKNMGIRSVKGIKVEQKKDRPGIKITVEPGLKRGVAHIPVMLNESGMRDRVYNEFHIGEGSQVLIMAGCGVHNDERHLTQHDGIHTFFVGEGARVKYIERHYGSGVGSGRRVLNPTTVIHLAKGSSLIMETVQIEGVDRTIRTMKGDVAEDAKLVVKEKVMTSGAQTATMKYELNLDGKNSGLTLSSRSVAKGKSRQKFESVINGNNECTGHSECDAIIMDEAYIKAVPDVTANHPEAKLIHEAAIGKIAEEQIMKLMTFGLSKEEAEQKIIDGFLR